MCEPDQKTVPVRDAVGLVLSHDITEVNVPRHFKGSSFRRGHVITEADIPKLLDLGKENIYVLEMSEEQMHEDDAVIALAQALAGENAHFLPEPREGRINIIAGRTGLLKVDTAALERFNSVGEVMCATRHTNTVVQAGDIVAGTRAIPLVVERESVEKAAAVAREAGSVISVLPLKAARVALVITGNEVYTGRIDDAFEPIIRAKAEALGCEVTSVTKCPDNILAIKQALNQARGGADPDYAQDQPQAGADQDQPQAGADPDQPQAGADSNQKQTADLIIMTGGMSVDPDDLTPLAARETGAEISAYGSAVLPGAMFMVGYFPEGTPVLGVPACGLHHPSTIFDLILPRVLAGEKITGADIARLGHGGLCLDCPECNFPVCPFGKSA